MEPPSRSAAESSEARASAELRGWLEAGEHIVVLLAPRGAARRRVLAALGRELEGRFAPIPWSAGAGRTGAPRPSTVEELRPGRGARPLLLVEEGERLGAEGARVLRALAHDASAERCAVVVLAPEEAGAVLGGLGPGLEVVVLRSEPGPPLRSWLRTAAGAAAALLAAASFGIVLALLLPRFGSAPPSPPATSQESALLAPPAAAPRAPPSPVATAPPQAERLPDVAAPAPAVPPKAAARADLPPSPPAPRAEEVARSAPAPDRPAAGWLVVNAIPRAFIAVDGAAIGETPIVRHPIPGGRHLVSARFDDGREHTRSVEIAGREHYLLFDGR